MNRWIIAILHATFPRLFACEKDYRPPISTLSQRGCHNFLNINCFANLTLPDPTFRLTMKPSTTATFLAIVTATLGFGSLAQAQDLKVGIVDMNRVFSEYYKTKDAEKRVNEDKSTAKKELDERAARYRDLMQKWNDKQKMITDKLLNEDLRQQAQKAATSIASEIKSLERDMDEFRRRAGRIGASGIVPEGPSAVQRRTRSGCVPRPGCALRPSCPPARGHWCRSPERSPDQGLPGHETGVRFRW